MKISFISSFAPISADPAASKKLFVETLGLPLEGQEGDEYVFSEEIGGSKHFGVWPLSQAAQACFGSSEWPKDVPVPQASLEFDVESPEAVGEAIEELQGKGYEIIHKARTEPWGQTIARLQTPEGLLIGISFAPWMHEQKS